MYRFNRLSSQLYLYYLQYLNTTHVSVQYHQRSNQGSLILNLNTTHVSVQSFKKMIFTKIQRDLNTTHVSVQ